MAEDRNYSDEERAAALAALKANGWNVKKTSREVGVPRPTLIRWRDEMAAVSADAGTPVDTTRTPPKPAAERVAPLVGAVEREMADLFEDIAFRSLRVARRGLKNLGAKDAITAAGIAVDKMRLLRDQPTDITEQRDDDRRRLFRDRYLRAHGPASVLGADAPGGPGSDAARQPLHTPPADGAAAPLP